MNSMRIATQAEYGTSMVVVRSTLEPMQTHW